MPEMKFKPGDRVIHPEYGRGKCIKTDPDSKFMRYFFKFEDTTTAWFSEVRSDELKPAR